MAGTHNKVLPRTARLERWRVRCRLALAGFYGLAGVQHLAVPEPFLGITPSWVPQPEAVIALTGVSEIAGAIGLLVPAVRTYAAVGLALYAVGVFPAPPTVKLPTQMTGAGTLTRLPFASVRPETLP